MARPVDSLRSEREVHATFARHFSNTRHHEQLWFEARLPPRARAVPPVLQRFIVRKLAGMVLVSNEPRGDVEIGSRRRSSGRLDRLRIDESRPKRAADRVSADPRPHLQAEPAA